MKKIFAPWRMEYISHFESDEKEKCIFCHTKKESLIYKNENFVIVQNKYPYTNGHIMVAPKRHGAMLEDLSQKEISGLFEGVQLALKAINKAYNPKGANVGINIGRCAGAGIVDHLHVHIVPRWDGDTNFMPVIGDVKIISEGLKISRERIKSALNEVLNGKI